MNWSVVSLYVQSSLDPAPCPGVFAIELEAGGLVNASFDSRRLRYPDRFSGSRTRNDYDITAIHANLLLMGPTAESSRCENLQCSDWRISPIHRAGCIRPPIPRKASV